MAFIFNAKSGKVPFVEVTLIKKIDHVSSKAFNLINVILIKKISCASFKTFNLMNFTPVKKISRASFKAFDTKNNTLIKIIQLVPITLKATLAKTKRVAAAYFKEVN